jgi:hypothetical protein
MVLLVVFAACGNDLATPPPAALPKRVRLLTDAQYTNAVHDLLGDVAMPAIHTPGTEPHQFIYDDEVLAVDAPLLVQYRIAAEQIAHDAGGRCGDMACVDDFASRAFRRPLESAERAGLAQLFAQGGFALVVEAVLQAPSFVYRVELGDTLDAYELATELGFLYLDSLPDEPLWAAARDGSITDPGVLAAHIDRLLALPRVQAHLTDVVMEWLGVHRIETLQKSTALQLSDEARHSMYEQARLFIHDVMWRRHGGLRELLTSNEGYIDAQLAAWYPDVTPSSWEMRPHTFKRDTRGGGILTHPGVLAMLGTGLSESIIYRGIWVHRTFLCSEELGRPPFAAIAETASITRNFSEAQLAMFRSAHLYCSKCHRTIDPPGIAMHGYDVLGRYRTYDSAGQPIDSEAVLEIDGTHVKVNGAVELAHVLADSDQVGRCVVKQLAHHALGRAVLDPAMRGYLEREFERSDRDLVEVFRAIATSPMFRTRKAR